MAISYSYKFRAGGTTPDFDAIGRAPYFSVAGVPAVANSAYALDLEPLVFDAATGKGDFDFGLGETESAKKIAIDNTWKIDSDTAARIKIKKTAGGFVTAFGAITAASPEVYVNISGVTKSTSAVPIDINGEGIRVYTTHADYIILEVVNSGSLADAAIDVLASGAYITQVTDYALKIYDNRGTANQDASVYSYCSLLMSPSTLVESAKNLGSNCAFVLPHDVYLKLRWSSTAYEASTNKQGGVDSNFFSAKSANDSTVAYKPMLWAYSIGSDYGAAGDTALQSFFNSYAVVLRPADNPLGTFLELALVKFSNGVITEPSDTSAPDPTFTALFGSGKEKGRNFESGSDGATKNVGYLYSANATLQDNGSPVCIELAKSAEIFYNSTEEFKLNLKISIRKHRLSDSSSDSTYLLTVSKNDDYNAFGSNENYYAIMSCFVSIPSTNRVAAATAYDYRMIPMMYVKYINTNAVTNGYGATSDLLSSSAFYIDQMQYRMQNSNSAATTKRY